MEERKLNVLFICTSNKDRSPALENYFSGAYPKNNYKSAGVNKYFCGKKDTQYLTLEMLQESDVIVFAEKIHGEIVLRDFPEFGKDETKKECICILGIGEYEQGKVNDDYLMKADLKLKSILTK
jgi:predicted protein tyrosine phosphatase